MTKTNRYEIQIQINPNEAQAKALIEDREFFSKIERTLRASLRSAVEKYLKSRSKQTKGIDIYIGGLRQIEIPESLHDYKESALTELQERLDSDTDREIGEDNISDIISEIADSHVPIYNSEILELAAGDNELAFAEPEIGPAHDGKPTPINIITANIYEAISNYLHENSVRLLETRSENDELKTEESENSDTTESNVGEIVDFQGNFGSGIATLVIKKDDGKTVRINCENAPTVRALSSAFDGVIGEGHTVNVDALKGCRISWTEDDLGLLSGFEPA